MVFFHKEISMFGKVIQGKGFEFQKLVKVGGDEGRMGVVVGLKGVKRGNCLRLTIILRKQNKPLA